jgi:CubicO group peptidase (beta-lactamase class C family)
MTGLNITKHIRNIFPAFILLSLILSAGCGGGGSSSNSGSQQSYGAAIEEGRAAANEMLEQTGASSMTVGLYADGRIVWTEGFGYTDEVRKTVPSEDTMFGIGSTSKMIATVAAMILVDQGKVGLDEPVKTYIPDFEMLSSEYEQVTVRMLLNHSSGFPGSMYRISETTTPIVNYADQLVEGLKYERLKHAPGFMQTYCNDGFTLIEKLVRDVSGSDFPQFIQDEIFDPLGMDHSRFALSYFPDDSYAASYTGEEREPQIFVNAYASGGLNSTPADMLKLAMMIIGKGKLGDTQILSGSAIATMGTDQTIGKFNPVVNEGLRYGLGWDTVAQPAFKNYGIRAWEKGGDVSRYGSDMIVLPDDDMAVFVAGTTGIGSEKARKVAERILLRALTEKGRIASFPEPLPTIPKDIETPTQKQLDDICGYFAAPSAIRKIESNPDGSITFYKYMGNNVWTPILTDLKMRTDGFFSTDTNPLFEMGTAVANLRTYLIIRQNKGAGHYQDDTLVMEKVSMKGSLNEAWSPRLARKWLLVNESPDSESIEGLVKLGIEEVEGLEGMICVSSNPGMHNLLDASVSGTRGSMLLFLLPQAGRDIDELTIFEPEADVEWVRFGTYIYRPMESVQAISSPSTAVIIGDEGYDEWLRLDGSATRTVTIISSSAFKIWDADSNLAASGDSSGTVILTAIPGNYYVQLFGKPGDYIMINVL